MKKLILIIVAIVTFYIYGETSYPGDSTYNVKYYKLNLKITSSPNYLSGSVTMSAVPVSGVINSIFVDLQNTMTVDSVVSNGTALSYTHQNAKININLGRNYQPNEFFQIEIFYRGVPGSSGFGSFAFSTHGNNVPAIWTLSEPYGTSDWWPVKDNPADKADSADIWITCATGLTAISNGILVDTVNNGDGFTTFKWKEKYPIAQYLIAVTISNFYEYKQYFKYSPTDSMPVVHYIYPESFISLKDNLDKTVNMLDIFSEVYELYPFIEEKYGHVQFGWGGGMEHQTISSMGSFNEGIVSHELAHQWFGDKVTMQDWHHIWLNEGFATYSTGVYYEAAYGKDAYNNFISQEMSNARNAQGTIYVTNISSIGEIFNSARSYSKGGIVLHMLRGVVGDSVFFQSLRKYLDDYAFSNATTEDFKNVVESIYGQDLDYFFQQWIYGVNFPRYSFNWVSDSAGDNYKLMLHIKQSNNLNPTFFTMPIDIKVDLGLSDTIITVFNNQADQRYEFTFPNQIISVVFDPDNKILKGYINETGELPEKYTLEQNYPNPFNPLTTIRFSMPGRSHVKLIIRDVLGNEVKRLIDEEREGGNHEVQFFAEGIPSGVYFYTLYLNKYENTRKMMIIK